MEGDVEMEGRNVRCIEGATSGVEVTEDANLESSAVRRYEITIGIRLQHEDLWKQMTPD